MIQTINKWDFEDAFNKRDTYKNNFSYEGKKALFDYLEEYEESTGEQIELDIVALCCDYSEYDSFEDLKAEYNNIKSMEDLEDHTTVIKIDGTDRFIIQQF